MCKACNLGAHWIVDCPQKVSKKKKVGNTGGSTPPSVSPLSLKGTKGNVLPLNIPSSSTGGDKDSDRGKDKGKKKNVGKKGASTAVPTGTNLPGENKVFISGLSFSVTKSSLITFLEKGASAKDNDAKVKTLQLLTFSDSGRCNGQAIVQFEGLSGAARCLLLDGKTMDGKNGGGDKKDGGGDKKRYLKVERVLPRTLTAKGKGEHAKRVLAKKRMDREKATGGERPSKGKKNQAK